MIPNNTKHLRKVPAIPRDMNATCGGSNSRLNLLAQAIACNDPDRAAELIRDALGIESDDVVNYCFPKN